MKNFLLFLIIISGCYKVNLSQGDIPVTLFQADTVKTYNTVVLLCFNGYFMTNFNWNEGKPLYLQPDSVSEKDQLEVLNRLAEPYSKFRITFTRSVNRYNKADACHRMRIIFTPTHYWYNDMGEPGPGVAFIGSMLWGDNTPCFVFSNRVYKDPFAMAEVAKHELGHTIGLFHQSIWEKDKKVEEYAPFKIMGDSEGQKGEWGIGINSLGKLQDDVKVIDSIIGTIKKPYIP